MTREYRAAAASPPCPARLLLSLPPMHPQPTQLTQPGTPRHTRALTAALLCLGWLASVATSAPHYAQRATADTSVAQGEAEFFLEVGAYFVEAPTCLVPDAGEDEFFHCNPLPEAERAPVIIEGPVATSTACEVGGEQCDLSTLCGPPELPCTLRVIVSLPELSDGTPYRLGAVTEMHDSLTPGRLELSAR